MNNASTVRVPISTLDDDARDDLLSFIEERRKIQRNIARCSYFIPVVSAT
jgi:hypothetical protein